LKKRDFASKESHFNTGRWQKEEHQRFLLACYEHKEDWNRIEEQVGTRSIVQIRTHAQKYLLKLCKKYSIRLKTKKFKNRISQHLNFLSGKCNISSMSKYDKNIFDIFKYYDRELLKPSEEEPRPSNIIAICLEETKPKEAENISENQSTVEKEKMMQTDRVEVSETNKNQSLFASEGEKTFLFNFNQFDEIRQNNQRVFDYLNIDLSNHMQEYSNYTIISRHIEENKYMIQGLFQSSDYYQMYLMYIDYLDYLETLTNKLKNF